MISVAFNTLPLKTGHAGRGTGTYTRMLIDVLQKRNDIRVLEFTNAVPNDADVVHYPYFDPFLNTLPLRKRKPTIVTVHDLIPVAYSHQFPRGIKGEVKWRFQQYSLRSVDQIITDSEASKNDIERLVPYPKERISVIYLSHSFGSKQASQSEKSTIQKKYSLPESYFLYVGDINWNKNIPFLLEAMKKVNIPLILVGKAFLSENIPEIKKINDTIHTLKLEDRITKLGFVPGEDLQGIYTMAKATIIPSTAEGFGLPVLESMSCLTPTLVADVSSLHEIAGPAIRFDPHRVTSLEDAMKKVLVGKRSSLVLGYRDWVSRFSWEKVGEETARCYKKVGEMYEKA